MPILGAKVCRARNLGNGVLVSELRAFSGLARSTAKLIYIFRWPDLSTDLISQMPHQGSEHARTFTHFSHF
jgi:hypothetical protein